jgi:hypothetical protein
MTTPSETLIAACEDIADLIDDRKDTPLSGEDKAFISQTLVSPLYQLLTDMQQRAAYHRLAESLSKLAEIEAEISAHPSLEGLLADDAARLGEDAAAAMRKWLEPLLKKRG